MLGMVGLALVGLVSISAGQTTVQRVLTTIGSSLLATPDGTLSLQHTDASRGIRFQFGAVPTVGTCGTNPSVSANSTDTAGSVDVGTGGIATSCTVTFSTAWTNAPYCVASNRDTSLIARATATTTVLTITSASAFTASDDINWICLGRK